MSAAQRERAALVATMRSVGPNAPTLCAGCTTRKLAAAPATSAALAERLDIAWVTADPVAGSSSEVTCPVTVVPN